MPDFDKASFDRQGIYPTRGPVLSSLKFVLIVSAEKLQKCTDKTDHLAVIFVKLKIAKMREEVLELCEWHAISIRGKFVKIGSEMV